MRIMTDTVELSTDIAVKDQYRPILSVNWYIGRAPKRILWNWQWQMHKSDQNNSPLSIVTYMKWTKDTKALFQTPKSTDEIQYKNRTALSHTSCRSKHTNIKIGGVVADLRYTHKHQQTPQSLLFSHLNHSSILLQDSRPPAMCVRVRDWVWVCFCLFASSVMDWKGGWGSLRAPCAVPPGSNSSDLLNIPPGGMAGTES